MGQVGRGLKPESSERPYRETARKTDCGKVFVRVLAEGCTRIIRFSDVDDSLNEATNEQAFDVLKSRKQQLKEEIEEVHQ